MGDIADDLYNQFIDGMFDDDEYTGPMYSPFGKCRRCGAPIEFVHTGVRWRLYERGAVKLHNCATPAAPDEFPLLED